MSLKPDKWLQIFRVQLKWPQPVYSVLTNLAMSNPNISLYGASTFKNLLSFGLTNSLCTGNARTKVIFF